MKSSYVLAAVALAWAGGIVLLHTSYVQPNLARQSRRIERDSAAEWLRLANYLVRTRRGEMLRVTSQWVHGSGLKAYFLGTSTDEVISDEITPGSLRRNQIEKVILCDADGRALSAWTCGEGDRLVKDDDPPRGKPLGHMAVFRVSPEARNISGVGNTPSGLVMFARCEVRPNGADGRAGHVVSLRRVDELLFAELSATAGVNVRLQHDLVLPAGKALPTFGQVVWRTSPPLLRGAQVFRDSFGSPVGYMVVEGDAKATYRHTQTVERALTLMMLWAIGFAVLMIMVIHVVISSPMAKLVNRVERLRNGEPVEDLSGNLHGEALVLAKQFEEALLRIEKISQTDALTELKNRRCFQQVFTEEFRRARRYHRPLTLAVIDVDFFKAANDALGHQVGDEMLKIFADVIRESVRVSDVVARLGGDEFAILMPETTGEAATAVAERIRACLAGKVVGRGDVRMSLTASIGLVDMNVPGAESPESFFNLADQALYAAKRGGRNRVLRADHIEAEGALADEQSDREKVDRLSEQLARLDAKFKRLFVDAIGGLISALEARDEHTANHSAKVRRYTVMIARQMSLPERTIGHIARAAMLHDIGKIGLPDSVLLKESKLTDQEWEVVKRHPTMSVRIMEGMAFLDQEIPAVRYHHERYDGCGYPEGLAGSAIPLAARILSVADAFDAMTSSRMYRGGKSVDEALSELRGGSGTQFDPAVVAAFLQVVVREVITDATLKGVLGRTA